MQGILLVDKTPGWTSFDAVNYTRNLVARAEDKPKKQIKVGHSGTLDPFATGLLVLLIGKEWTRRAGEFSSLDKTYEVGLVLNVKSSTGDPEGELETVDKVIEPTEAQLRETLSSFIGTISQVPPAYSAIKVGGERAYKLARAGKSVTLEPREIRISRLELISYKYPMARLVADVSSGTYVRSLVEDIGKRLGTMAYTKDLRRTHVGSFDVSSARNLKELDAVNLEQILSTDINKAR